MSRPAPSPDDLERLFDEAVDLPPEKRRAFAERACAGDEALRQELLDLLDAHEGAAGFLEALPREAAFVDLPRGAIVDHYEIVGRIGSGAMGDVYRAVDTRLRRTVALKILAPHLASSPQSVARFAREARAASALSHPNVVQIHDVGSAVAQRAGSRTGETLEYIAMEHVDGESLREIFRRPGDLAERLAILADVASALERAHAAGIIHRDLKPENVMVSKEGLAKVVDFGLAKLVEGVAGNGRTTLETRDGIILGTVGYMSPEQVQGQRVDHRTDVFSFGCVLYEAVTGQAPFAGTDSIDTLHRIVHAPARDFATLSGRAPRRLQALLRLCLEKDPARRCASFAEVESNIRDILGQLTRPIPVPLRPRRGRAAFARIALALVLTLAVGASVAMIRSASLTARADAARAPVESLVVLPFANRGAASDAYLADGITEDLITRIGRRYEIRVVPWTRAATYRRRATTPAILRGELDVHAALSGAVLRKGDELVITVVAVDVRSGKRLWTKTFERPTDEITGMQSEIGEELGRRLGLPATTGRSGAVYRVRTGSAAAYDQLLRGRYEWNRWTEEGWRQALVHFQAAITHDPLYALAHAGLSDTWTQLAFYGYVPVEKGSRQAKAAALKALQLDDTLGEASMSLAVVYTWFEHDYARAEEYYRRATTLSPNSPEAWLAYSRHLGVLRRHREAIEAVDRAWELNPASLTVAESRVNTYRIAGRYAETIEIGRKLAAMYPESTNPTYEVGQALEALGRHEEALEAYLECDRQYGADAGRIDAYRRAFAAGGIAGYWKAVAADDAAATLKDADYALCFTIAAAFTYAGQYDSAIEWIERGLAMREPLLVWIGGDPVFDVLRGNPRFDRALRELRLR